MKVEDEGLLDEFRQKRFCERCQTPLRYQAHPHHIHSRGAGRVDIRGNLIALGGAFDCNCHGLTHDGKIGREELLLLTALREGLTVESIVDEVHRLRRLDKDGREPR